MPELDEGLALSERLDPEAVPAVVLLDGDEEQDRVEGLHRARLEALFAAAGATLPRDGLPEIQPGCTSITQEPEIAARLAAKRARAAGRIRARELDLGALEDPFEALHQRGLTDGLPVVPPTPERVVALLEHTSRDRQDLVGVVPPYGGRGHGREGRHQRGHGGLRGAGAADRAGRGARPPAARPSRCTGSSPPPTRPGRW